ncbi:hypothetical protein L345_15879, partial [Ophiophagus hannah]
MENLEGKVVEWVMGLHNKGDPELGDPNPFLWEFRVQFGDLMQVRQAESRICAIRQGNRPMAEYIRKFQMLARKLRHWLECNQPGHRAAECSVPPLRVTKHQQLPKGLGKASDHYQQPLEWSRGAGQVDNSGSLVEGAACWALLGMIDDLSPSAPLQEPYHQNPVDDRYSWYLAVKKEKNMYQ